MATVKVSAPRSSRFINSKTRSNKSFSSSNKRNGCTNGEGEGGKNVKRKKCAGKKNSSVEFLRQIYGAKFFEFFEGSLISFRRFSLRIILIDYFDDIFRLISLSKTRYLRF